MNKSPKNEKTTFPNLGIMFKKFNPTFPRPDHILINDLLIFLFVSYFKFSAFLKILFFAFIWSSLNSIKFDFAFEIGFIKVSLKKLDLKSFGIVILFFF